MDAPHLPACRPALQWDVFCHVVDNHGDLGVCWRLAVRLSQLGHRVRLWVDDARALAWMAPVPARPAGVQVLDWRGADGTHSVGDAVVEGFGCTLPARFVGAMRDRSPLLVWINLEHLTAEPYALRCHGLPSPQSAGPGAGLTAWFFYPGFKPASGGLLQEDGLIAARERFDALAWLAARGIATDPQATRISLFCYDQPALPAALDRWSRQPTQLLVTPGPAAAQVAGWLGAPLAAGMRVRRGALDVQMLPWLPQPEFDHLLWSCDLNHVRGEDSLVRALWAGRPFVWQLYPQHDGAHAAKLAAFAGAYLEGADIELAAALRSTWSHWNGLAPPPAAPPDAAAWQTLAAERSAQWAHDVGGPHDLADRLQTFVWQRLGRVGTAVSHRPQTRSG